MAEKKKKDELVEETEAATKEKVEAPAAEKPKVESKAPAETKPADDSNDSGGTAERVHKRAEKVGVVFSDKMTKTVVVRVDRTVKHPLYRKYMKKRGKFMAHNELGASEGDRVKIVETRPLSARKRWRVVEIIQKAQK